MADLDKKILKAAPDLVQSVLEAQEKKNHERADMLITNAIKQLKMSRFKPDQTTCLSLTYLARINPRVFKQSTVIKDTLKSLLRRDNGPTNIKGKSDIVLPVLSANILLACCDTSEVRTMILSKIDQWLGGSTNGQKASDLIQHLLVTLCMKCQGDQQTIVTLIEMRQYWLQYLKDNSDLYQQIPVDLCASIRKLLHSESSCESLIGHLDFLVKHDNDIDCLGDDMGRFILERPLSLNSMLKQENSGYELNKMILKVFIKFFKHLQSNKTSSTNQSDCPKDDDSDIEMIPASQVSNQERPTSVLKQEPKVEDLPIDKHPADDQVKQESKSDVPEFKPTITSKPQIKPEPQPTTTKDENKRDQTETTRESVHEDRFSELPIAITYLYIRMPDSQKIIKLNKETLEALLDLISSFDDTSDPELEELLRSWLVLEKSGRKQLSNIYEDFALTKPHNLHDKLRQKLIQSRNELLVDLGLRDASASQLIALLQQFGLPLSTIDNINKRIVGIKDTELLRSKIEDLSYFNHLLDLYHELGSKSSKDLQNRLTASVA